MHSLRIGVVLLLAALIGGCGGGSAGGSNSSDSAPPPAPPSITYGGTAFTFSTGVPVILSPTNTGGAATAWSISPALPSGFTFNTTNGYISGTATDAAVSASYLVIATNAGGSSKVTLTLGTQAVLLNLGHADSIHSISMSDSVLLSQDAAAHWVLWNYTTGTMIAQGTVPCTPATCNSVELGPVLHTELAGPTAVIQMPADLAVYSATDGSTLGSVSNIPVWWHLASDGSYICGGSQSSLTAWSPSGAVIATRPGNYSKALVFCAPGAMRVALGAAGSDVIEAVSLPSGSSSVGPAFQGTFNSWFIDGSAFLTNVNNTVWVYSNASTQLDFAALSTTTGLTGQQSWYWTNEYTQSGVGTVTVYKVGAGGAPAATYTFPLLSVTAVGSGTTIGILGDGMSAVHVVDLSGATPVQTQFAMPVASPNEYAAVSASQWIVGNGYGVLLDGASLAGTPRYFGYGQAWSIAGGSERVAIATAAGQILYFDTTSWNQEGVLPASSTEIALSSDGSVLAARASGDTGGNVLTDDSVRVYSLPSGALVNTWPYTFGTLPWAMNISVSGSGALLGQVVYSNSFSASYTRQVTAAAGGPTLWSDTISAGLTIDPFIPQAWPLPIRLSADGTLIAVSSAKDDSAGTNIYLNDALTTAVPGWAVGWLANNALLVNFYSGTAAGGTGYASCAIYDTSGTKQSVPPLPETGTSDPIQMVDANSIYDDGTNKIYSIITGTVTWSSASSSRGRGAIAGSRVVFASGAQVVAQPF
jgi:hypothetical protein